MHDVQNIIAEVSTNFILKKFFKLIMQISFNNKKHTHLYILLMNICDNVFFFFYF